MKVMFVSIGSYGLVMPVIGAAAELARRGHEPVVLTHPRGRGLVERAGFRCVDAEIAGEGLNIEGWWTPLQIVPQFALVEDAIEKETPDVIVADHFAIGAIAAARDAGVPVAVLGPAAFIHPLAVETSASEIRAARYAKLVEGYNKSAALLELPLQSQSIDDSPFLGDRYLLRSVPSFEPYADVLPDRVRFVGACLYDTATHDGELAAWMRGDDRPVAFLQLDKLFDFNDPTAALLELLEERDVRVAAALGPNLANYAELDSDSFFLRDHLPQSQVLTSARLAVSTGHPLAVLGAISAGVPNLIIDFGSGASEILHCCVTAGNGLGIAGMRADAESMAPLLDRLLNDGDIHSNARRVQRAFEEVHSFAVIADVLDELFQTARSAEARATV